MKASKSKNELKEKGNGRMDLVDDLSGNNIRLIGIIEVLAGMGLILPQLTGFLPWLAPLSAAGLTITMIAAIIFHVGRGDGAKAYLPNFILLLLAASVAYGRFII